MVTKLWKADEVTNTGENEPGWRSVVKSSLVKVVFDETFKAVTPTSTYQWFWQCKSLETIEGIKYLNVATQSSSDDEGNEEDDDTLQQIDGIKGIQKRLIMSIPTQK